MLLIDYTPIVSFMLLSDWWLFFSGVEGGWVVVVVKGG